MPAPSPWWNRARHADRRPLLLARARMKSAIRGWFEAQGFIEVDTACLQVSPGNETHLHAFATEAVGTDLDRQTRYLHTSPEFAMKKLLAAGEPRIFSFAPCFRNRERGPLHAPEFTMLEWYRTEQTYDVLFDDCAEILRLAASVTGRSSWSWKGNDCDVSLEPNRLSVAEAFAAYAGISLLGQTTADVTIGRDEFAREARRMGIPCSGDDTWSDIFSKVLTALIEPRLGCRAPFVLHGYPVAEAALARTDPLDPRTAERFELYCCGVELANGFGELTDPIAQRANLERQMSERQRIYGERYPIDEDFLATLAHMPEASGCALGFERLVMLAAGATHIDQVQWTPAVE
ncbi:MAG: EF-P lysine aminoacylase GenX [Hyphomicrobium sp.]|nr:MAG: EF-P lysine aminoacylase GenX [Hyphomicrobium sp.]